MKLSIRVALHPLSGDSLHTLPHQREEVNCFYAVFCFFSRFFREIFCDFQWLQDVVFLRVLCYNILVPFGTKEEEEAMKAVLRTIFCILSVLCVAAAVVIGMIFGLLWALICIAGAAVFAGLMLLAKREKPAPEEKPDFMKSEEENRAINEKHDRE